MSRSGIEFGWILGFAALVATARGGDATGTATQVEVNLLADAMTAVYLDTGRFTTLENLDDQNGTPAVHPHNGINFGGGTLVVFPNVGRPALQSPGLGPSPWGGPYVSFVDPDRIAGPTDPWPEGTPLDYYFRPYQFYTPLGLIDPQTGLLSLDGYGDEFDEYMVVSLGLDGIPSGDDLTRSVGFFPISGAVVSSARLREATARGAASYIIAVKGYQLGSAPGTVTVDGVPLDGAAIRSWTPTLIEVEVGEVPAEDEELAVTTQGGQTTIPVTVLDERGPSSVIDWSLY